MKVKLIPAATARLIESTSGTGHEFVAFTKDADGYLKESVFDNETDAGRFGELNGCEVYKRRKKRQTIAISTRLCETASEATSWFESFRAMPYNKGLVINTDYAEEVIDTEKLSEFLPVWEVTMEVTTTKRITVEIDSADHPDIDVSDEYEIRMKAEELAQDGMFEFDIDEAYPDEVEYDAEDAVEL